METLEKVYLVKPSGGKTPGYYYVRAKTSRGGVWLPEKRESREGELAYLLSKSVGGGGTWHLASDTRKVKGRGAVSGNFSMSKIKALSLESGSPYFSRSSSKFFGPESFYGPYAGPGGIFFVQANRAGVRVKRFDASDASVRSVDAPAVHHVDDARELAKALARGGSRDRVRARRRTRR